MDLVARKMMDGGAAAFALLDQIEAVAASSDLGAPLTRAVAELRQTTQDLIKLDLNNRFAGAVSYLGAFARVLGAQYHIKAAMAGPAPRVAMAKFFLARVLPEVSGMLAQATLGADDLYALSVDDLAA
jgi:hypothetical protein